MNVSRLELPALHKLIGYLAALSDCSRRGELKWRFEVSLFEYTGDAPGPLALLGIAYPEFIQKNGRVEVSSLEDVTETLRFYLGLSLNEAENGMLFAPLIGYNAAAWHYIHDCIDLERAQVAKYVARQRPDGLPSGITGDFTFVMTNERAQRALTLSCGDAD